MSARVRINIVASVEGDFDDMPWKEKEILTMRTKTRSPFNVHDSDRIPPERMAEMYESLVEEFRDGDIFERIICACERNAGEFRGFCKVDEDMTVEKKNG